MTKNCSHSQDCPVCGSKAISYWGCAPDFRRPEIEYDISRCCKCTHLFVNALPSLEYLKDAYTSVWGDKDFFQTRTMGPFSDGDKWVWKHVSDAIIPGHYLDVGAANLKLLRQIAALGLNLTLVEPGAHAEILGRTLQCNVYKCLFEECAFPNKFDIIAAVDVLEHVRSPINFLVRIKAALSDEGFALLRFPNSRSLRCALERRNWRMIRPLGHLHYFTPRSFRTACKLSGLRILTMLSHDVGYYNGIRGMNIRGLRFMSPVRKILDRLLLGDQLLVKIARA